LTDPTQFQQRVFAWFEDHGRKDLPWQQELSPYRVWVSEIMLQQTQVKTVIPYFEAFMRVFPTIEALAAASEDQVLHLWTGLGYYARARNLLRCAQVIVDEHGGKFPDSIETLEQLPGIGRSTAGAIRSIAFGKPAAILDGNVKRVLARHAAIPGWPGQTAVHRELWEIAQALSPQQRPAQYTQAMMDLGATVCLRSKPLCESCPLQTDCKAHQQGTQADYPGRKPRKTLPIRTTTMLIISNTSREVFLAKRPPTGIWGGLWSFPELEQANEATDFCLDTFGAQPTRIEPGSALRHTFSHYHLDIQPLYLELDHNVGSIMDGDGQLWYNLSSPERIGMAAPVAKLLKLIDK